MRMLFRNIITQARSMRSEPFNCHVTLFAGRCAISHSSAPSLVSFLLLPYNLFLKSNYHFYQPLHCSWLLLVFNFFKL